MNIKTDQICRSEETIQKEQSLLTSMKINSDAQYHWWPQKTEAIVEWSCLADVLYILWVTEPFLGMPFSILSPSSILVCEVYSLEAMNRWILFLIRSSYAFWLGHWDHLIITFCGFCSVLFFYYSCLPYYYSHMAYYSFD